MMRRTFLTVAALMLCTVAVMRLVRPYPVARGTMRQHTDAQPTTPAPEPLNSRAYLGFDRNEYPGDAAFPVLRKTFAYTSYWLGPPPGEKINSWQGKRELLNSLGFGFLVLYLGRDSAELKNNSQATQKGTQDSHNAISSALKEGFAKGSIIFLDIEEGGRLPETYHGYLKIWAGEIEKSGYRAGVYCSGIPVKEGPKTFITTAADIRDHFKSRGISIWAFNDACPPSPGCAFPENAPSPSASGISEAAVWQFAQSPRRKEFAAHCPANYHPNGNCYAPGDTAHSWFLDVNSATSADPSNARK